MLVIMIIEWYQAETRTDKAVMILNDSDNDNSDEQAETRTY